MPSTPSRRRFGAVLAGGALLLSVAIGSAFAATAPAPVPAAHVEAGVAPAAPSEVTPAAPVAAAGPEPDEVTPVAPVAAAATAPAEVIPAATVPAAATAEPEPAPGGRTVVETNDNEAMVFVDADGEPSASLSATEELRDEADEVRLYAYGDVSAGVLALEIELTNRAAGPIAFPGGLRAQVTVTRDGVAWKTLEVSDPTIVQLAPGGTLTLHATVPGAGGPAAYGFAVSVETLQP